MRFVELQILQAVNRNYELEVHAVDRHHLYHRTFGMVQAMVEECVDMGRMVVVVVVCEAEVAIK